MSKKLFALESEGVEEVEVLATDAEIGEVAEVEAESQEEVVDIQEQADSIEEGVDASEHLEEIEEVVGKAAEGEGLDEVAAEAIRIAVEAIAARVGAEPKSVYALYAAENFQSASSKKANTQIALEGVKSFLSNLWGKIKAALTKLWDKVATFWNKHFTGIQRVKTALESLKAKVGKVSGDIDAKKVPEKASSALAKAFVGKNEVSASVISDFIKTHEEANKIVEDICNIAETANNAAASMKEDASLSKLTSKLNVGSEGKPFVGGVWIDFEVTEEDGKLAVTLDKKYVEDKEEDKGIVIATKDVLAKVVNEALGLINATLKMKDSFGKRKAEFKANMEKIEKIVAESAKDKEAAEQTKKFQAILKAVYKLNAKVPALMAEKSVLDVKLAKVVVGYTSVCLKAYA